jgi:hypothetical protein
VATMLVEAELGLDWVEVGQTQRQGEATGGGACDAAA